MDRTTPFSTIAMSRVSFRGPTTSARPSGVSDALGIATRTARHEELWRAIAYRPWLGHLMISRQGDGTGPPLDRRRK